MRTRLRFCGILFLLLLLAVAGTACLRSRVRITSDPPGAVVKFRGQDWGPTPVTIPFIWYWYYDIDLQKEGYQPVHAIEYFRTPPYAYFPLDFFAEILPIPITDTRKRHYELKPVPTPAAEEAPATASTPAPAPTATPAPVPAQ